MKKTVIQMMLVVGFAIFSVSFAQAQTAGLYKAEIPFDFSVGKKQYAAGQYLVEVRGEGRKYFVIRDASGRNSYAVMSNPARKTGVETAGLDFQRIGEGYFLSSIRASELNSTLPIPQVEDRLARDQERRTVTVVLSSGAGR